MKKLYDLSLCLFRLGLNEESFQIKKEAQIGDLTSIGYPMIGARIINELVKDKWDLIVGKWLLDHYFDKLDIKSIIPNYFSFYEKNPIWQIKALNGCYLLLREETNKRESLLNAKDDGSIMSLVLWLEKKKYDQTEAYTEQEISDYDRKYFIRTSPISPDENIKG